jgi:hypothetical protein
MKSTPSAPTTRMPKRRWYANAPPGLHYALGPTLPRRPRDLADREFATPNLLPFGNPNTGVPILRILCHLSMLGSAVSVKSGNRPPRFKSAWDSCLANPDSPMRDGNRPFVGLWLKPLAAPSKSDDPEPREPARRFPSRRFSSAMKRSLLRHLAPMPLPPS